jgi:hypothetical protein
MTDLDIEITPERIAALREWTAKMYLRTDADIIRHLQATLDERGAKSGLVDLFDIDPRLEIKWLHSVLSDVIVALKERTA